MFSWQMILMVFLIGTGVVVYGKHTDDDVKEARMVALGGAIVGLLTLVISGFSYVSAEDPTPPRLKTPVAKVVRGGDASPTLPPRKPSPPTATTDPEYLPAPVSRPRD